MAEEGRTELAGLIDRVWPEWTCSRTWWPRACRPHPRATVGCSIENGPLPSLNCRNASTRALPPRSRHRTPRHRSWKRDGVRSAGPTHRMTAPSGCDRRLGWRLGRQTGWSTQRDCDGAGRDLDTGASLARRSGLRAGTFAPCSSLRTWGRDLPQPPGWLLAHVAGWDAATVDRLLDRIDGIPRRALRRPGSERRTNHAASTRARTGSQVVYSRILVRALWTCVRSKPPGLKTAVFGLSNYRKKSRAN